ncbi:hypothetical protein TASIC1_0002016800 [Trichoderma asperellum]|uniref:Uncharacterized protein n=1 Tax=Trichoderma asperellum TaxID=101201 RepID=A0A6V8QKG4_TRIAP|nr:hypothetical protein TASIC1_0002016800 [Trichoderma asperellum]
MPATAALPRLDRWAQYLRQRYSLPRRLRGPVPVSPRFRSRGHVLCYFATEYWVLTWMGPSWPSAVGAHWGGTGGYMRAYDGASDTGQGLRLSARTVNR